MGKLNENALLQGLLNGEEAAYKQLIIDYRGMVQSLIYRMIGDEEDALDLSQEVFVQVWESIGGFKAQSSIKTWVYTIAVRKALNYLRAKKIRRFFSLNESNFDRHLNNRKNNEPDGFQVLNQQDMAKTIHHAIEKLPPNQRTAFVLSKTHGLSDAETAAIMDTTIGAVESLLIRAKRKLKEELKTLYNEMKNEK